MEATLVGPLKYFDETAYLQHVTLVFSLSSPLPCLHAYIIIIIIVPHFAGFLLKYGLCHGSYTEPAASTILAQVMKLCICVPLHSTEDTLRFGLYPQSPEQALL